MDDRDPRTLRLYDLATHEAVVVTCQCGRISEYRTGCCSGCIVSRQTRCSLTCSSGYAVAIASGVTASRSRFKIAGLSIQARIIQSQE
jgi:hypothetical protein